MFESILCQVSDYDPGIVGIADRAGLVEIARFEGREGRRIGHLVHTFGERGGGNEQAPAG